MLARWSVSVCVHLFCGLSTLFGYVVLVVPKDLVKLKIWLSAVFS